MVDSNSSLDFMLPGKRPAVGGEVVVTEESGGVHNFKKHKATVTDCFVSTATAGVSSSRVGMGAGHANDVAPVGNGKAPMIGGQRGNSSDIDEDLHSRQLAVYGRETMRRLFASNVLISGMQGLGAEIGERFCLNFIGWMELLAYFCITMFISILIYYIYISLIWSSYRLHLMVHSISVWVSLY